MKIRDVVAQQHVAAAREADYDDDRDAMDQAVAVGAVRPTMQDRSHALTTFVGVPDSLGSWLPALGVLQTPAFTLTRCITLCP
jgi:hypothetical protein